MSQFELVRLKGFDLSHFDFSLASLSVQSVCERNQQTLLVGTTASEILELDYESSSDVAIISPPDEVPTVKDISLGGGQAAPVEKAAEKPAEDEKAAEKTAEEEKAAEKTAEDEKAAEKTAEDEKAAEKTAEGEKTAEKTAEGEKTAEKTAEYEKAAEPSPLKGSLEPPSPLTSLRVDVSTTGTPLRRRYPQG